MLMEKNGPHRGLRDPFKPLIALNLIDRTPNADRGRDPMPKYNPRLADRCTKSEVTAEGSPPSSSSSCGSRLVVPIGVGTGRRLIPPIVDRGGAPTISFRRLREDVGRLRPIV